MGVYRAKAGSSQSLVSLVYIGGTTTRYDPRGAGFLYPEIIYGLSNVGFTDGSAFTEWLFQGMSYADFAALDTLFGTSLTTLTASVTIYTLKEMNTYVRCNATVQRPIVNFGYEKGMGGLRDVIWRFTGLQQL